MIDGHRVAALAVWGVLAVALAGWTAAQEVGNTIMRHGQIGENYYAAGGTVRLTAQVEGDVVAAAGILDLDVAATGNVVAIGGEVRIQRGIAGDLFAAAGSLETRGLIEGDARIAGGEVTVFSRVDGDLLAAGGRVIVAPGARVGGRTALAGASVRMDGTVERRLLAAGRTVRINGVINGDADIQAQEVVLGPAARINGALSYRSPASAQIDPAAKVGGKIEHVVSPMERAWERAQWLGRLAFAATAALTVFVLGVAWFGLFPGFSRLAPETLAGAPWRSLAGGLIVLVGAPIAAIGLAATVIGLPLAGLLALVYPSALALGLVTSAFLVADLALKRTQGGITAGRRVAALLAAAIALGVIMLVPVLGGLVLLAGVLFGTGAFWLRLIRADAGR